MMDRDYVVGDLIFVELPVVPIPVVEKLPVVPVPGVGSYYKHYGIYCGYYEDGAFHVVFDFDSHGPHLKSLEEFSGGRELKVEIRSIGDEGVVMERINSIFSLSPEECQKFLDKYNLWSNNCEHVAFWCKTGKAQSYQIDKVKRETGNRLSLEITRHGPKVANMLIRQLLRG
jgi:hypothetical protein